MGYGQDFLSGSQLVSQLKGDFPHLDNLMTTAPFAYNMSVHELNLAVIKQTMNKEQCDEVFSGYEWETILRIRALWKTRGFVFLMLFFNSFKISRNMSKKSPGSRLHCVFVC